MNISEILKARGMFSKDIRIRLKNGQLQLNGEVIREDVEITSFQIVEEDDKKTFFDKDDNEVNFDSFVQDAGDFLFLVVVSNPIWVNRCHIFGFENLFNCNINNELTYLFSGFNLLKISKREFLVIKK